jgi:hypothetical protein
LEFGVDFWLTYWSVVMLLSAEDAREECLLAIYRQEIGPYLV